MMTRPPDLPMDDDEVEAQPQDDFESRVDGFMSDLEISIQDSFQEGALSSQWDPSAFPQAKNVIDWITGPNFLGVSTLYDYPRQYQILRDAHELLCPRCNDLAQVGDCWDRSQYDMKRDVLLEYGVCPKCKWDRIRLAEEGYLENIEEILLILGMRSGKSTMIGKFDSTYVAHRMMLLKDPLNYYKVMRGTYLEAGFFAASKEQTKDTIWNDFYTTLLNTPWFIHYVQAMQEFANRVKIPWKDAYFSGKSYMRIVPQALQFVSYHSKAVTTAGRTRFRSVVDEMGKFDGEGVSDEIHGIPYASLHTLIAATHSLRANGVVDPPPIMMVEIGSPGRVPERDPLECRFNKIQESNVKGIYSLRLPTWEANKFITRPSLDNEFATDPLAAERNFGAKAVSINESYFPPGMTSSAFLATERPGVIWSPFVSQVTAGDQVTYTIKFNVEQLTLNKESGPLIIVGDAGRTRDRFAIAILRPIGSGSNMVIRVEGLIHLVPTVVDTPTGKQKADVDYLSVLQLLDRMKDTCKVGLLVFDRWDSTMIIQKAREMGIPSMQEGTSMDEYGLAKGEFSASRIHIPCKVPPYMANAYSSLREEIDRLRRKDDGKVDHPPGGHNDLIQVVCKGVATALDLPDVLRKVRKASGRSIPGGGFPGARVGRYSPGAAAGRMNPNAQYAGLSPQLSRGRGKFGMVGPRRPVK